MFAQSKPFPEMIGLVCGLKAKYGLKIVVVSNEGQELNAHRIRQFKLDGFVDAFISSCFVRLRKPDADIFKLALDIAQTPARQIIYVEKPAISAFSICHWTIALPPPTCSGQFTTGRTGWMGGCRWKFRHCWRMTRPAPSQPPRNFSREPDGQISSSRFLEPRKV